jgi:hypothetical protein
MKSLELYKKYIAGFILDPNNNTAEGNSPFGNGKIHFSSSGEFNCDSSNNSGNITDFVSLMNPNLSPAGVAKVIEIESKIYPNSLKNTDKLLLSFRRDIKLLKTASYKLGVPDSFLKKVPVRMESRGFKYHSIDYKSPNQTPLTVSTFNPTNPLARSFGIPRFPNKITDTICFTENPIQALWIEELFGWTSMIWPKYQDLENYNYQELLKNKQVIIIHGEFNYAYADSFLPFQEEIRSTINNFSSLNYRNLSNGQPFLEWIKEAENQTLLKEDLKASKYKPPIAQAVYNQNIHQNNFQTIRFPLDTASGHFFYGINDGRLAQSWPLDILDLDQAAINFRIEIRLPKVVNRSVKLDKQTVININDGINQLTPFRTYTHLKQLISDHIYFGDNQYGLEIVTLWIMATYVHRLFQAFPYLHIQAPFASGKTTLLEIISECAFNGVLASRITNAHMMNEVDETACTLCLDEFEEDSSTQSDVTTQILNAGYKKSGTYMKMSSKDGKILELYSPKAFASISEIKASALKSRTLKVPLQRKPDHQFLATWDLFDVKTINKVKTIAEGGYALGLFHHSKIEYLIARFPKQLLLPNGMSLTGRNKELAMPLIILSQLFDHTGDLEQTILKALQLTLFPDQEEQLRKIKLLTNQLKEWAKIPDIIRHNLTSDYLYLANKHWKNTSLLHEFEGKKNALYDWLKSLGGAIKIETQHIPKYGNESCLRFPLDLILNGKEIREWFQK